MKLSTRLPEGPTFDLQLYDPGAPQSKVETEETGWNSRRFNPAFARIIEEFPEGRVSQEIQAEYPARYVAVTPEDRVRLKKLLADLEHIEEREGREYKEGVPQPDQQENGKLKLSLGFFEYEFNAPLWIIAGLLSIAAIVIISWYWPDIENRFNLGFANSKPVLVNPPDAVTLTKFPRLIDFEWDPLGDAVRYIVELELEDPPSGDRFPHPYDAKSATSDTSISIEFVGDQAGRWRVIAVSDAGVRSSPSEWHEFIYQSSSAPKVN